MPTSKTDITVRPARIDDARTIADFNVAMALETEDKQLEERYILPGVEYLLSTRGAGFYLVALANGAAAGCLAITYEWSDWRCGNFWWIQSVYVHPDYRRLGVFRALYDDVMNAARAAPDCCGIRLYVEKENTRAQQTYLDLGMIETGYRLFEVDFRNE
ncbi:MAG: GNAT family N-acetyltransferase [Pseudomonadales bacterium]|nr:GNAT family N-acetyltransferase [Pseudomonadales bacterium]